MKYLIIAILLVMLLVGCSSNPLSRHTQSNWSSGRNPKKREC